MRMTIKIRSRADLVFVIDFARFAVKLNGKIALDLCSISDYSYTKKRLKKELSVKPRADDYCSMRHKPVLDIVQ